MMRAFTAAIAVSVVAAAGPARGAVDGPQYFRDQQRLERLISAGQIRTAFELVHRLNQTYPDNSLSWWQEGRLAGRLELWDAAVAAYERSFALGTAYEAVTARRIAEAHARAGRKDQALIWLERAVALGLARRYALGENDAFASYAGDPRFLAITGLARNNLAGRTKRWEADIDFLVAEARRMHADPGRPAYGRRFTEAAAALKNRIKALSDTELAMEIQRLVVRLGDGHSYVRIGEPDARGAHRADIDTRTLPVFFHPFQDQLFIINGSGAGAELTGSRVLAFGGVPLKTFIERARPYLHKDNRESWKFIGGQFAFRHLALHLALGTADGDKMTVKVRLPDGSIRTANLTAGDFTFPRKLRPMPGQSAIPMFLRRVDTTYWAQAMPEKNAHYLQINNFRNAPEGEGLGEFAKRTIDEALTAGTQTLIIDFRLNNGGNNGLCDGLLQPLLRYRHDSQSNRIFVITRHETFSAAQNCSTRIEALTNAVFAGEPSSSRPNFTGEESEVMLPHSGLIVSISNRYWQDSQPWDNRPWIDIDLPAPLTFEDYRSGTDPALKAIFAVTAPGDTQ